MYVCTRACVCEILLKISKTQKRFHNKGIEIVEKKHVFKAKHNSIPLQKLALLTDPALSLGILTFPNFDDFYLLPTLFPF